MTDEQLVVAKVFLMVILTVDELGNGMVEPRGALKGTNLVDAKVAYMVVLKVVLWGE